MGIIGDLKRIMLLTSASATKIVWVYIIIKYNFMISVIRSILFY